MKKVLLNKSQVCENNSPNEMALATRGSIVTYAKNKINNIENKINNIENKMTSSINGVNVDKNNIYEQRKSYKSIYSELFSVLFRLPDINVQQRVLNAINGRNNICKICARKIQTKDVGTQTSHHDISNQSFQNKADFNSLYKTEANEIEMKNRKETVENMSVIDTELEHGLKIPIKRGRKRKTCVPRVVKESHAQQTTKDREDKHLIPIIKTRKIQTLASRAIAAEKSSGSCEVDEFLDSFNLDELATPPKQFKTNNEHILHTMAEDYLISHQFKNGLLPIHDSIIKNEQYQLQRQIFIWTKIKLVDLNEIVSTEDEDCLQLAIIHDCYPNIIQLLLDAKLSPNYIYEFSNNIIHIAVLNNIEVRSLAMLMDQVDLKLLLNVNDDGLTPLHIAVRHNQYEHAEILMDAFDKRVFKKPLYRRQSDTEKAPFVKDGKILTGQKSFGKYYEKMCDEFESRIIPEPIGNFTLKRQLVDICEARNGRTCLLYAVENEMEHMCYFLLAHLSNPTLQNFSGHTPKSFHYEYARTLQISLKVSRVMDRVSAIIKDSLSN